MKKSLLKSILLLCALVVGTSAWADTYTIGWGDASGAPGTFTNFTDVSGSVTDVVSFDSKKNSSGSNPAYNSSSKELRLYYASNGKGGSITLTPAAGVTITGFVMTTSTTPTVKYSVNGGDLESVTASSSTYTVTGISASSLEIQNANTSNTQLRIKTIQITYNVVAVTKHTATFNVNGATTSADYAEGEDIVFPSDPSNIGEKKFVGWTTSAIVSTTDDEPAFVTSAKMGTSDITYYAVFASQADVAGDATLTIVPGTTNIPTSYDDAATDYTLEGKKFTIHQMYKNGAKLQFKASVGYITNKVAMNNIKSVVITYNSGDSNKNFTLKVGDATNPTSGTEITPSISGSVYTFDCSSYNKSFFVLKNGTNAGYLDEIAITYEGFVKSYSAYCTTVPVSANIAVTIAASGFSTIASGYGLDFSNATPAGLEAYVVSSVSTSAVTLASIDEAPASTGVILKGAAGTEYSIPVKSAATFDGTNKLKAAVDPTGVDDNTVYIMKGGKFCKVSNMSIVPAGKAYLLADDVPASARELNLEFDNETTGVTDVRSKMADVRSDFYDVQGRKVANPTKGLYIVNGKKVVIK